MRGWLTACSFGLVLGLTLPAQEVTLSAPPGHVTVVTLNGPIGPATAEFIARTSAAAGARRSECLVIELDTPGGLLESTKQIVQTFYVSPVPVVVYVTPSGANAGSAGCILTLAADVAAMAPHTSIGAAHPVELGSLGGRERPDDIMTKKLENFAVSYVEAIANKRGRNAEWARASVRDSASITAERALDLRVIDLLARDLPDLLRQLDGRQAGEHRLHTAAATVERLEMLTRERVFHALWRPEVMFVLMLVAIYGIISELSNPGAIFPGVAGAIALVLALYMGTVLPVNVAGVALILLAVALFVVDLFAATHGVLTVGGIIAFFLGSLMLFDPAPPAFRLPLLAIVPATVITALFFLFVAGAGLRAQRLPVRAGQETMLGQVVVALTPIGPDAGAVRIEGEQWSARCPVPVAAGEPVVVIGRRGLTLLVKPQTPEAP